MKVVGTGAPRMLTVRFKPCEVGVLRDELHHRRAVITEAAAAAHEHAGAAAGEYESEIEDRHDELFLIVRALDDLRTPTGPDQPREIVAPTWILGPVIRWAAVEAAERLQDAVSTFAADTGKPTADQVRAAVDTASAMAATLIALDHAENYAVS